MSDEQSAIMLSAAAPEARTGWVKITRLDERAKVTEFVTIAKVVPPAAGDADGGSVLKLSRTAMQELGLVEGEDFGVHTGADETFIALRMPAGQLPKRFVPLHLEPIEAP